jgi:hypothetical protein
MTETFACPPPDEWCCVVTIDILVAPPQQVYIKFVATNATCLSTTPEQKSAYVATISSRF